MQSIKSKGYRSNLEEVEQKEKIFNTNVLRLGNKKVIVVGFNPNDNVVAMEETKKVPIYKQAMQMQMGRYPQSEVKNKVMYHPILIENQSKNEYLEVWESDARYTLRQVARDNENQILESTFEKEEMQNER